MDTLKFTKNAKKYFAPGRINIIGEHVDCYGGKVLPVQISLGTYGVFEKTDNDINLYSENYSSNGIIKVDINNLVKTNDWTDYVKAVLSVIDRSKISGFNLSISGTLPTASGLSSSASLEVLVLNILNQEFNLGLTKVDIAVLAQKAENNYIGVKCGIMDQFAIALSKRNHAVYLDTNTLDYSYANLDSLKENGYQVLIINSKKPRSLINSKYNERTEECQEALKLLHQIDVRENICSYTLEEANQIILPDVLKRRITHVITENDRVREMTKALEIKDIPTIGKLLNDSHTSLRDNFEVSCMELDVIVNVAQTEALGSRMIGAGFGGCAIAIVEEGKINGLIDKIKKSYFEKTGLKCDCYVASFDSCLGKIEVE